MFEYFTFLLLLEKGIMEVEERNQRGLFPKEIMRLRDKIYKKFEQKFKTKHLET